MTYIKQYDDLSGKYKKAEEKLAKLDTRIAFLRNLLESLPGPLDPLPPFGMPALMSFSESELQELKNRDPQAYAFAEGMLRMEPGLRQRLVDSETPAAGHCGEEAYLTYLGRCCPWQWRIRLPESGSYTVEVIDTWNMTRKMVLTDAGGMVEVSLPSREYMAILATWKK